MLLYTENDYQAKTRYVLDNDCRQLLEMVSMDLTEDAPGTIWLCPQSRTRTGEYVLSKQMKATVGNAQHLISIDEKRTRISIINSFRTKSSG